jgi:hypothetical protein
MTITSGENSISCPFICEPVHEQAIGQPDRESGHNHIDDNGKRGDSGLTDR